MNTLLHLASKKTHKADLSDQSRRWLAGSSAVGTLVAAPFAMAGTVQITLIDNQISQSGGDTLKQDLTGDSVNDLPALTGLLRTGPFLSTVSGFTSINFATISSTAQSINGKASNYYKGIGAPGNFNTITNRSIIEFATKSYKSTWSYIGEIQPAKSTLFPITFKDARINENATTNAFLEVRFSRTRWDTQSIQLVRVVFDEDDTVAPTEVNTGGNDSEWLSPEAIAAAAAAEAKSAADAAAKAAELSTLSKLVKKTSAKLKKAKKSGNTTKAKKIAKKLKKLKKQLKSL